MSEYLISEYLGLSHVHQNTSYQYTMSANLNMCKFRFNGLNLECYQFEHGVKVHMWKFICG